MCVNENLINQITAGRKSLLQYACRFIENDKEVCIMIGSKKLGMQLLGIWLILTGVLSIVSIPIPYIGIVLAILAIVAGILLLFGK